MISTNVALLGLSLVCAVIGRGIAGIATQQHWQPWKNNIITLAFIILASIADVLITGQITGISAVTDIVCAMLVVVVAHTKTLDDLGTFLQNNVLVFGSDDLNVATAGDDTAITATQPPMTPYPTPTGLDLRSSALPPSRRPQFVDPSPSLHSRPIVQITMPSQPAVQSPHTTAPMPATASETPEPIEESPTQS